MSKLKAQGNASGTGVFTLETPATNTDRTLTLPDSTGTLVDTTGANFTGNVDVSGTLTTTGTLNVTDTLYANISNNRVTVGDGSGYGLDNSADDLVVANTLTNAGMSIVSSPTDKSSLFFLDTGASSIGKITYSHSTDDMVFTTTNSERMRILSTGGITFNGDTAAANALDDYEEGTWTPTLTGTGVTYDVQHGKYTKIGDLVTATFYIDLSSKGSSSGQITFGGLPYGSGTTNNAYRGSGSIGFIHYSDINDQLFVRMGGSGNSTFNIPRGNNNGTSVNLTYADIQNSLVVSGQVIYYV